MDSLNDLIKEVDKILAQTSHIKSDNPELNRLHDETMKDLQAQKDKLNKILKDVDNIK